MSATQVPRYLMGTQVTDIETGTRVPIPITTEVLSSWGENVVVFVYADMVWATEVFYIACFQLFDMLH